MKHATKTSNKRFYLGIILLLTTWHRNLHASMERVFECKIKNDSRQVNDLVTYSDAEIAIIKNDDQTKTLGFKIKLQGMESWSVERFTEIISFNREQEQKRQEYESYEIAEENQARAERNKERQLLLEEQLKENSMRDFLGRKQLPIFKLPLLIEPAIPYPKPSTMSFSHQNNEAGLDKPREKSSLVVVFNETKIADLSCQETSNPVDNISSVKSDVKGKYNGGGSKKADPRASSLGIVMPKINRITHSMWCSKKTLHGSLDLSGFGYSPFNVSCEYVGIRHSDD